MKLIASTDLANGSLVANIDSGTFKSWLFIATGTNLAAQTLLASDLGNIQITRRNKQFVNMDFNDLQSYNDLKGGKVGEISAVGADFEFGAILNFGIPGDNVNVMNVEKSDGCTVQVDFNSANIATKVSTGLFQIYGIESDGIMAYLLNVHKFDMSVQSGDIPFDLPASNLVEWLIENDSNLTKIQLSADGDQKVNGTKEAIIEMTSYENDLETYDAATPFLDINLLPTGGLESSLVDNVNVIVSASGSATINSYLFHLDYNLEDYQRSTARSQSKIAQKFVNTKHTDAQAKSVISQLRVNRAEAKYSK